MTGSLARLAGTLSSPLSEPTPNRVAMSMIGLVQRNHDIDVGQRPPGHLPSALARARTSSSIITVTRIIASYYRGMATADATTGPAAGPAERVRASPPGPRGRRDRRRRGFCRSGTARSGSREAMRCRSAGRADAESAARQVSPAPGSDPTAHSRCPGALRRAPKSSIDGQSDHSHPP